MSLPLKHYHWPKAKRPHPIYFNGRLDHLIREGRERQANDIFPQFLGYDWKVSQNSLPPESRTNGKWPLPPVYSMDARGAHDLLYNLSRHYIDEDRKAGRQRGWKPQSSINYHRVLVIVLFPAALLIAWSSFGEAFGVIVRAAWRGDWEEVERTWWQTWAGIQARSKEIMPGQMRGRDVKRGELPSYSEQSRGAYKWASEGRGQVQATSEPGDDKLERVEARAEVEEVVPAVAVAEAVAEAETEAVAVAEETAAPLATTEEQTKGTKGGRGWFSWK